MKLTCNRDKFSTLFSLAAAVVSAKDIKAVLQNVKMTVKSNKLILDATDMDNSIRLVLDEVDILDEPDDVGDAALGRALGDYEARSAPGLIIA